MRRVEGKKSWRNFRNRDITLRTGEALGKNFFFFGVGILNNHEPFAMFEGEFDGIRETTAIRVRHFDLFTGLELFGETAEIFDDETVNDDVDGVFC